MALPSSGLRGVEKKAEMAACTNNMAESNSMVKEKITSTLSNQVY